MRRFVGLVGLGLVLFHSAGCGNGKADGGVRVEGKVAKGDKPLAVDSGQTLNLSLTGKGPKGDDVTYPATVNSDGTFVVPGPGGGGIPPGKYKITVSITAPMGNTPADLEKSAGLNKQFTRVNGQEFDVGPDPVQKITIDTVTGAVNKEAK